MCDPLSTVDFVDQTNTNNSKVGVVSGLFADNLLMDMVSDNKPMSGQQLSVTSDHMTSDVTGCHYETADGQPPAGLDGEVGGHTGSAGGQGNLGSGGHRGSCTLHGDKELAGEHTSAPALTYSLVLNSSEGQGHDSENDTSGEEYKSSSTRSSNICGIVATSLMSSS